MFETEEFEKNITRLVARVAGEVGLKSYQTGVASRLVALAQANEGELIREQLGLPLNQRKGETDAYKNAEVVVRLAAHLASVEGRETLTLSDFQEAYQAKFCTIWPFCK